MNNDDLLRRMALLEKSLEELKEEYLRRNAAPSEPLSEPAPVPPPEPPKSELIKIAPEASKAPENVPPLPPSPAPEPDMRTIQIKAPRMKTVEEGQIQSMQVVQGVQPIQAQCGEEVEVEKSDVFGMPLEWFVGGKLFGSLGMLLILVGICFGVVYAYKNFNMTPELRVMIACVFSVLISGAGFLLKNRKYRFLSLLLKGGGLGGLYISIFVGYNIYGIFDTGLTAGILAGIALSTFALSWFERSQVIGVFATVGAFAVPLLVQTPEPNHVFLCAYLLAVNLPVVFLGLKRNWQLLYNLGFGASLLIAWAWTLNVWGIPHIQLTFWSIFTVEYLLLALIKLRGENDFSHRLFDGGRIIILCLINFAVLNQLDSSIVLWCWLAGGALLYGGAALAAWLITRRLYGDFVLLLGGAAAFLALLFNDSFSELNNVYLAWAVEALALGLFAFFARNRGINRLASLMALAAWLAIHCDYSQSGEVFTQSLFFNHANVFGKIGLLLLLIQGGLGMWRFGKSVSSKIVTFGASFGLIAITSVNAGYYFHWHEPWLLFNALALAVASLIYCWSAHFIERFRFLKQFALAWFAWLVLVACHLGGGPFAAWELGLWPLGAVALYWALPRGNVFRIFGAVVCMAAVAKSFYFQGQAGAQAFFNMPFLTALLGGVGFLSLNWTPPWLREEESRITPKKVPHYVSWGVIVLAAICGWNFVALKNIYDPDYFLLRIEWTLLGAACVLGLLARNNRERVYAMYASILMLAGFVAGILDYTGYGPVASAFAGLKLYNWLGMLAVCWGIVSALRPVTESKDLVLLKVIGGSLFIFIIYREFGRLPDPAFAKAFSLIFLALAAVLICGWGLWKRRRWVRYYSFILLAIAISQLIEQSLFRLRDPARILAFIALGLLLLGLSFIYHRVSALIDARERADRKEELE